MDLDFSVSLMAWLVALKNDRREVASRNSYGGMEPAPRTEVEHGALTSDF